MDHSIWQQYPLEPIVQGSFSILSIWDFYIKYFKNFARYIILLYTKAL